MVEAVRIAKPRAGDGALINVLLLCLLIVIYNKPSTEQLLLPRRINFESKEDRAKNFHSLVLLGKLRTAVRWIMERDTGGVLQPAELCTKTWEKFMEVLRTKQPDARTPTGAIMDIYPDRPPELVPVDITENTVTEVTGRHSRGAWRGGTGSVSL